VAEAAAYGAGEDTLGAEGKSDSRNAGRPDTAVLYLKIWHY